MNAEDTLISITKRSGLSERRSDVIGVAGLRVEAHSHYLGNWASERVRVLESGSSESSGPIVTLSVFTYPQRISRGLAELLKEGRLGTFDGLSAYDLLGRDMTGFVAHLLRVERADFVWRLLRMDCPNGGTSHETQTAWPRCLVHAAGGTLDVTVSTDAAARAEIALGPCEGLLLPRNATGCTLTFPEGGIVWRGDEIDADPR